MATLTTGALVALRQAIAVGEHPSWSKQTLNVALQSVEDVLEAQALDADTLIEVTVATDARSQAVKDDLDGSRISANLRPVVEDWLNDHPTSVTTRSVDRGAITDFLRANARVFNSAVAVMPERIRDRVMRLVIERRVRAVL